MSQVGATIAEAGGQVMFRGSLQDQLCGDAPGRSLVAIRFADMASPRKWHDSPAYHRLVPIRRAAADVVLGAYEN